MTDKRFAQIVAGGVTAGLIGLLTIPGMMRQDPTEVEVRQEIAGKIATLHPGQRMAVSESAEIEKLTGGGIRARISAGPKYRLDADARRFVTASRKRASGPQTYTAQDYQVTYTPLHTMTNIETYVTEYDGMTKEEIILRSASAAHVLSWGVATDATVQRIGDELVFFDRDGDPVFQTLAPTAADLSGLPVPVRMYYDGGVLTYEVIPPEGVVYPITVDPTTTQRIGGSVSGRLVSGSGWTYTAQRDTTDASYAYTNALAFGQKRDTGTGYEILRSYMAFPVPAMSDIDACSLYVYVSYIPPSISHFGIDVLSASAYRSALDNGDFSAFDGWQSSGAYNGTVLNTTFSTSSISAGGWYALPLNAAGRDSTLAAQGDTLWIAMISHEDYLGNSPGESNNHYDYITLDYGTNIPYLSMDYNPIMVTDPNGGETWLWGTEHDITWSAAVDSVSILLMIDGEQYDEITRVAGDESPYPWTIPEVTTTTARIRVVATDDSTVYDESDDTFAVSETLERAELPGQHVGYHATYDPTYTTARNAASSSTADEATPDDMLLLGQRLLTGVNYIYRQQYHFEMPDSAVAYACTLYIYVQDGSPTNNFDIQVFAATEQPDSLTVWNFPRFDGHQSTGAYNGELLTRVVNTGSLSSGQWIGLPFSDAGLDSLNDYPGDTFRVMLLSSRDATSTAPSGSEYIRFRAPTYEGYEPYLAVTYVDYDIGEVYTTEFDVLSGKTHAVRDTSYAAARAADDPGDIETATADTLGLWQAGAGDARVYRMSALAKLRALNSVTAGSLLVDVDADLSDTDFRLYMFAAGDGFTDDSDAPYYSFSGHEDGAAPYSGVSLIDTTSTNGIGTGRIRIPLSPAGMSWAAAAGDTARFVLLSSHDASGAGMSGRELLRLDLSTARLKLTWSLEDSVPGQFAVAPISEDSLLVTWQDRTYDEDGFRLEDIAGNMVAGTDTLPANTTSLRVGGLDINTLYSWRLRVIGGLMDGELSDSDSTYTNAVTPGAPSISWPANDSLRIVIDPDDNPAWTEFLLMIMTTAPETSYVDAGADTLRAGPPGEWAWDTFSGWGDTAGVRIPIGAGATYTVKTQARSGE